MQVETALSVLAGAMMKCPGMEVAHKCPPLGTRTSPRLCIRISPHKTNGVSKNHSSRLGMAHLRRLQSKCPINQVVTSSLIFLAARTLENLGPTPSRTLGTKEMKFLARSVEINRKTPGPKTKAASNHQLSLKLCGHPQAQIVTHHQRVNLSSTPHPSSLMTHTTTILPQSSSNTEKTEICTIIQLHSSIVHPASNLSTFPQGSSQDNSTHLHNRLNSLLARESLLDKTLVPLLASPQSNCTSLQAVGLKSTLFSNESCN